MMKVVAVVLALAVGAAAQNTFCERYTAALFSSHGGSAPNYANATNQFALVEAVVTCAFLGSTTGAAAGFPCGGPGVVGLYYDNLNGRYFNATSGFDYLAAGNVGALLTLATHLTQFFAAALGCRATVSVNPYAGNANMQAVHSSMNINQATFNAFIGQVASSMLSFGVSSASPTLPASDLAYVIARMGPFWRYTTSNNNQICSAADCQLATGFSEFDISSTGAFSILVGNTMTGTALTVNVGDAVHWNLNGGTDGIVQTATAAGTTPLSGGINSGTGISSYTWTASTAGTYYFYNAGNSAMSCSVTVTGPMMSSSTGMTGMTGMTGSTGMTGMTGTGMTGTGMTGTGMTGTATGGASSIAAPLALIAATGAAVAALLL